MKISPVTLRESQAITGLADVLYDFLPGSGDPRWRTHVTFKTVAEKVGVGHFWPGGSKLPAITTLLENTYRNTRDRFRPLMVEIIHAALVRRKRRDPITTGEIDLINGYLMELDLRIPELWDSKFRESVAAGDARAVQHVDEARRQEELAATEQSRRSAELAELQQSFFTLCTEPDRQAAGYQLEKILCRLFALDNLVPRAPFRVVGEQIDGSFGLDHETYLFEAKWEKTPLPERPLLEFRGKIEGKSAFTRGVFLAMEGITNEAKQAIIRGKQPTFFVINGHDLSMVLSGTIGLTDFLRQRQRILAEEGELLVPFGELSRGSRNRP